MTITEEHIAVMADPAPEPGSPVESGTSVEPGIPDEPVVRPAPHRWVWYAVGGGLPGRYRGWVLHDTTTGTWWLRHLARMMAQLVVPIALVLVLLPASWPLRLAAAGGGVFLALVFSLAYMSETTENRVMKAGYPAGTAQAARDRAALVRQRKETDRKHAAAARRAARYRDRMGR